MGSRAPRRPERTRVAETPPSARLRRYGSRLETRMTLDMVTWAGNKSRANGLPPGCGVEVAHPALREPPSGDFLRMGRAMATSDPTSLDRGGNGSQLTVRGQGGPVEDLAQLLT